MIQDDQTVFLQGKVYHRLVAEVARQGRSHIHPQDMLLGAVFYAGQEQNLGMKPVWRSHYIVVGKRYKVVPSPGKGVQRIIGG
jgi:hypothetical protein